jgi:DNA mismatch endonuclease (patch repair protein)
MADVHDKATRSYNMSRIKGKDTKPEMKYGLRKDMR